MRAAALALLLAACRPAMPPAEAPPLRCLRTETAAVPSMVLARGRDQAVLVPYTQCAEWGPR